MSEQAALFDADRTTPCPCPVGHCAAIRFPDQYKVPTCAHDLAVATTDMPGRRPRGCLNVIRPEHTPIPY